MKIGQTVDARSEELFVDEHEVSAYAEVVNGTEPETFYGSNYKHLEENTSEMME